jgi:ribokinase
MTPGGRSAPRVWVVGSVHMDVVALAERHPRVGETVTGSELHLLPGGKAANQAVASARAGVPTSLVSRLGGDAFAEGLQRFLASEGIDLEHTRSVADASTGVALIVVAESNNTIVVVPGVDAQLDASALDHASIAPADVVVAQLESPRAASLAAFERAQAAGALTILNAAPARQGEDQLLGCSDVIVVNETELAVLSGEPDARLLAEPESARVAAARLRRSAQQTVVVTLGASGAVAVTPDGTRHVEGHPVQALDTTGAGDCFVGNLAASLCRGEDLVGALQTANLAASLCVASIGAAVSMPTAAALEAARSQAVERAPETGARHR